MLGEIFFSNIISAHPRQLLFAVSLLTILSEQTRRSARLRPISRSSDRVTSDKRGLISTVPRNHEELSERDTLRLLYFSSLSREIAFYRLKDATRQKISADSLFRFHEPRPGPKEGAFKASFRVKYAGDKFLLSSGRH